MVRADVSNAIKECGQDDDELVGEWEVLVEGGRVELLLPSIHQVAHQQHHVLVVHHRLQIAQAHLEAKGAQFKLILEESGSSSASQNHGCCSYLVLYVTCRRDADDDDDDDDGDGLFCHGRHSALDFLWETHIAVELHVFEFFHCHVGAFGCDGLFYENVVVEEAKVVRLLLRLLEQDVHFPVVSAR